MYLTLKRTARMTVDSVNLLLGLLSYCFFKKQTTASYQALVRLFCMTRGFSNDLISSIIRVFRRPYPLPSKLDGILGSFNFEKLKGITHRLEKDGYYVFDTKLNDDILDHLLALACEAPCAQRVMDGEIPDERHQSLFTYPRNNPQAARYDLRMDSLVNDKVIQDLIADPTLFAVAQSYLKSRPIIDIVAMWWHTAFSEKPDKTAAQYFHFDMDRIKWLKFFFYITDVEPENGPHTFIPGSHRTGGIPGELLKGFYKRLTDQEVGAFYLKEQWKEFSGVRGTILAEDTRGLHKGRHVERGDRLVFQLQYCNSLFGGDFDRISLKEPILSTKLKNRLSDWPNLYRAIRSR